MRTAPPPTATLTSITDAATRHVRTTVKVNDEPELRLERVPNGAFMKVVKPSGSVARIPLHNGRANRAKDDPYRLFQLDRKQQVGCVPYDRCLQTLPFEVVNGYLPPKWYGPDAFIVPLHLRNRQPCRLSVNGTPINGANPCKCIEELIEFRKAEQVKRMAKVEIKNVATEAANAQGAAAQSLAEAAKGLAEAAKGMNARRSSNDGGAK
jgi:hypothetical protein